MIRCVRIELFYFDGCPSHAAFVPRLRQLLAGEAISEAVEMRRVESAEAAERERFLGSPTLRVNERDVDRGAAERSDYGLKCRLYHTEFGILAAPPDEWVLQALRGSSDGRDSGPAPAG